MSYSESGRPIDPVRSYFDYETGLSDSGKKRTIATCQSCYKVVSNKVQRLRKHISQCMFFKKTANEDQDSWSYSSFISREQRENSIIKNKIMIDAFDESEPELPTVETIKCELDYDDENDEPAFNYLDTREASLEEEEEDDEDDEEGVQEETSNQAETNFRLQDDTDHLITKGLSGIFKCSRCRFSCTSTRDLIAHYQIYRKKEPFRCFKCGYQGKDKHDFRNHSGSHFERTYFKCSRCTFRSESSLAIKTHIQEDHSKSTQTKVETYKCPLCDKFLASKWNLKIHLGRCKFPSNNDASSSPESQANNASNPNIKDEVKANSCIYTCPHCFFIFSSLDKRSKHIHNVHLKKKLEAEKNEGRKSNVPLIQMKIEAHAGSDADDSFEVGPDMNPSVKLERIYLCPVCHYVFTSASSLNKHIVTHSIVTECPVCKFECETNSQLNEHIATHSSSESKYPCTICEAKFPTLGKLKYHIKDEHSKKFKCPYCLRTIKTENALKLHIEAHARVKDFYCPKCKFTAKNSSLLQYHMSRFHPPKKRFICEICSKSYKYKYSLQRHHQNCPGKDLPMGLQDMIEKNTPEIEIDISQKEKLSCSECKATFKEAEFLKKHLLVHFHMTPFRCLKCGLRCRTKHFLSQHMKIHNIKANYECEVCSKKFKHQHALNNHSIIHSDERPYTCDICALTFKRKANYRRHYDIHSNIKPFRCPTCDFTARRKDGLQKHIVTHTHPIES